MLRNGQAIGRGKRVTNVATRVALHLGMVFEPQQEAFFELATERLPDSGALRFCVSEGAFHKLSSIVVF